MAAKDLFHGSVRKALEKEQWIITDDLSLYLAIPIVVHQAFFQREFAQLSVERYKIKRLIYHPIQEVIVQWIN